MWDTPGGTGRRVYCVNKPHGFDVIFVLRFLSSFLYKVLDPTTLSSLPLFSSTVSRTFASPLRSGAHLLPSEWGESRCSSRVPRLEEGWRVGLV